MTIPTNNNKNSQEGSSILPGWVTAGLLVFFVLTAVFASYMIFVTAKQWGTNRTDKETNITTSFLENSIQTDDESISSLDESNTSLTEKEIQSIPDKKSVNYVPDGLRTTILVMGVDKREGMETERAFRTDTMMLITIDLLGKKVGLLSIPRDLWVKIPGFESKDRINTANFKGDAYRLPGGGPALAAETIAVNLGIQIDNYIRLNFTAFEFLIDEIGGIEINVPTEIDDQKYPDCCSGYDPLFIPQGVQQMDGDLALKYSRTRSTYGGDFDRAARQQQVLLAVREKVLDMKMIPTLIAKAPKLYSTLSDSYDTDMKLEQIIDIIQLSAEINSDDIQTAVINGDYLMNEFTTSEGAQVVLLDSQAFRQLREQMFYKPAPYTNTKIDIDTNLLAIEESANIDIQNGSTTSGLANSMADYLKEQGFAVESVGNADKFDYENTIIYDYSGNYYTTRWLSEKFKVQPSHIIDINDPNSPVDIRIILGSDFIIPSS